MSEAPPTVEYAAPPPARKGIPPIMWWFLLDCPIFLGAVAFMAGA
jgi:hypothetical protein